MPYAVQLAVYVVFPAALALAALSDLLTMTIPNRLTLFLGAAFFVVLPLTGPDLATAGLHLAAGALGLALAFAMFAFGWIGGGDAKLAAAVALWFGWTFQTLEFVAYASVFGGLLTVGMLGFRRMVLPGFGALPGWVKRLHDEKAGVPYGIALACGALAVYPDTVWSSILAG